MLSGLLASAGTTALLSNSAFAQKTDTPPSTSFSHDWLKQEMESRAARPHQSPTLLDGFFQDLSYDAYRNIRSSNERARWSDTNLAFQIHPFHPGWLYKEPVVIHQVENGESRAMNFTTEDFEYMNELEGTVPENAVLPGIAGLRINAPLNRADLFDELIVFLGASYFRALGRGNSYGLSARGIAINTWLEGPEEFPRFSEFWLERPVEGQSNLVVYAALEGPSLTGAYRFNIEPGADTTVEVEATLFFREGVEQLGLAPLTSMFYYSEHSERRFNDYRPQVHDSDALKIVRNDGDTLYRPLNNPPRVSSSYFVEEELASFGLVQRDRRYEDYQDAGARYHDRPSVLIETLDDWGPGTIRLVEIPAELEIEDNIALFWVPETQPEAGETRTYHYIMHWGDLNPDPDSALSWVAQTGAGHGGPSGVPIVNKNARKFVVDFEGGILAGSPEDAVFEPVVTLSAGDIDHVTFFKVPEEETDVSLWRLVIDVDGGDEPVIEISAHIAGYGRKLTEIWMYQWLRNIPEKTADAAPATEQN